MAALRKRHRDAPSSTPQFEHRIAKFARGIAIKRHVLHASDDHRRLIVVVCDERIVQGGHESISVKRRPAPEPRKRQPVISPLFPLPPDCRRLITVPPRPRPPQSRPASPAKSVCSLPPCSLPAESF